MKKSLVFKSAVQTSILQQNTEYNESMVFVWIRYNSFEKTIYKEVLIYDTSGFLNQLGGVISLFLGFSIFTLICDLLDLIEKKI